MHQREIAGARPCIQLLEQYVVEYSRLAARDGTVRVVDIAEDNRLGRAALLAGGDDFAVVERTLFALGVDDGMADALQAIGAFLHDAAPAHGHFRVPRLRRATVLAFLECIAKK